MTTNGQGYPRTSPPSHTLSACVCRSQDATAGVSPSPGAGRHCGGGAWPADQLPAHLGADRQLQDHSLPTIPVVLQDGRGGCPAVLLRRRKRACTHVPGHREQLDRSACFYSAEADPPPKNASKHLVPLLPGQYGEFRQGYDKDTADTRVVFYGLRYILEQYVCRRWTQQARSTPCAQPCEGKP